MIKKTAVLTLATPLHHGSEKSRNKPEELPLGVKSNYTPHRRLPLVLKNGDAQSIVLVPAISGNSIRHLWRESLVDITLHTLGLKRKDLQKNALEMLVNGGGIDKKDGDKNEEDEEKTTKAKAKKKDAEPSVPVLVRDRETLRAAMPILSLFGCSYGNRMLPGLLKVGWAIPALKQTEHITNIASNISYSEDMTSFQLGTRNDSLRYDYEQHDEEEEVKVQSRQSIYYMEVVSAGIPFAHSYSIDEISTPIERSALQLAIDLFKNKPYLGGKSSTGHGEVQTDKWYEDLDVSSSLYIQFLKDNRDVIVEYLNIWNSPEKVVKLIVNKERIEFPTDLSTELDRLITEREAALQKELDKTFEKFMGDVK